MSNNVLIICTGLKNMFMSGYTANAMVFRGVLDEGVNFIQKPFTMNALAVKVSKSLGERDQEKS